MHINRYPPQWYDDLHAFLTPLRSGTRQTHCYALIDGVHDETCYPALNRHNLLPHHALYAGMPAADEETLCVSPLLVEYREDQPGAWDALLRKTDGLPALSIIVTPEPLTALAQRLSPWCVVDAAGYPLALAFADTRILPELFIALDANQRAQLCGPMLHWRYVARNAEWGVLPVPVADLPAADGVTLDNRQCAQLTRAAEADNLLFQLRATRPELIDCHSPAHAHQLVRHWLGCADHARMKAPPERRALCEWGLAHPGYEHSPGITAWLNASGAPRSLEELLRQWCA